MDLADIAARPAYFDFCEFSFHGDLATDVFGCSLLTTIRGQPSQQSLSNIGPHPKSSFNLTVISSDVTGSPQRHSHCMAGNLKR